MSYKTVYIPGQLLGENSNNIENYRMSADSCHHKRRNPIRVCLRSIRRIGVARFAFQQIGLVRL